MWNLSTSLLLFWSPCAISWPARLRMPNDVSRSQINSHCFPPKEEKNRRKTSKTTSSENSQIYGHRLYKKSFSLIFVSFSPPDDVHRELFMTQMKVQHIASCDVFLLSDAKHCVPCQTSGCFRSTFWKLQQNGDAIQLGINTRRLQIFPLVGALQRYKDALQHLYLRFGLKGKGKNDLRKQIWSNAKNTLGF